MRRLGNNLRKLVFQAISHATVAAVMIKIASSYKYVQVFI